MLRRSCTIDCSRANPALLAYYNPSDGSNSILPLGDLIISTRGRHDDSMSLVGAQLNSNSATLGSASLDMVVDKYFYSPEFCTGTGGTCLHIQHRWKQL